jgi:hypothetical protein
MEIRTEAAPIPEKECINGIFVAVRVWVDQREREKRGKWHSFTHSGFGLRIIVLHQNCLSLRSRQFEGQNVLVPSINPLKSPIMCFPRVKKLPPARLESAVH